MSTNVSRIMVTGLLSFFTVISGVWLSHSGKPINVAIFTIHKLIALATVIVIAVNVYQLYRAVDIRAFVEVLIIAVTGLLFIALFVTGALLSLGKPVPEAILMIHKVTPLLALISTGVSIYLLVSTKA